MAQFEQLGVGPPQAVPCLRYLWQLQALVDPFIRNYTSLRAIATLADVEDELLAVLNSFCVSYTCIYLYIYIYMYIYI